MEVRERGPLNRSHEPWNRQAVHSTPGGGMGWLESAVELAALVADAIGGGRDRRAARIAHEAGRGLAAFGWEPTAKGPTAWVATGDVDGRSVSIEARVTRSGANVTLGFTGSIGPAQASPTLARRTPDDPPAGTGDPAFDAAVASIPAAWWSGATRAAVLRLVALGGEVAGSVVTLDAARLQRPATTGDPTAAVAAALDALRALAEDPRDPRAVAATDPVPSARARALLAVIDAGDADPAWLAARATDAAAAVAVPAAVALGDAALLRAALARDPGAREVLRSAGKLPPGDDAWDGAAALALAEPTAELVAAARAWGGGSALQALRRVAGELRGAAAAAADEVAARVELRRGGVSLVEATATGALSIADGERGRLSEGERGS